jgi:hypothetical protein
MRMNVHKAGFAFEDVKHIVKIINIFSLTLTQKLNTGLSLLLGMQKYLNLFSM